MTGFFEAKQLLKFFSLKMDFRFQPDPACQHRRPAIFKNG
jgi:hypothetical protein